MIKPHYYFVPYGWDDECNNGKLPENQCVIQIWKVMMDNLFTQDKSSFSELLSTCHVTCCNKFLNVVYSSNIGA